jgi:putative FmdB family regulatory protein
LIIIGESHLFEVIGDLVRMPSYEFRCLDCHRRFELFFSYNDYGKSAVQCPYCKGTNVQRRIGRIRFARSDESRLENLADPGNLAGLEDDPRALGRMMRQMSAETGEDIGPEFDEVVNRLESGQSPDEIEKQMPDLGMGGDDAGGMPGMDSFSGGDDF